MIKNIPNTRFLRLFPNVAPPRLPHVHSTIHKKEGDDDLKTLREGIKLSRRLHAESAFDEYRGEELYPGPETQTDAQLDEYIRRSLHSANALTSSVRMGTDGPLDSRFRVRGVRGLRVVDASAMPSIPGGQTAAPVIMMAERAAEFILGGPEEAGTEAGTEAAGHVSHGHQMGAVATKPLATA